NPKKGCKMSEDMGMDGTSGTEGQEFPLPSTGAPGVSSEDETVAAHRRSPLTIAIAAFVAVVLVGSGIGIGWVLSRDTPRDVAVGRGASRAQVAGAADQRGVVDIDTFTTRTGLHQGI